jgi:hydrogenase expression/formation protein HypD
MKMVDEFRDPVVAAQLAQAIRQTARRPWVIMEVCGGQTHGLLRYGIDVELRGTVELIHGPGCPVCVTNLESVDEAQRLASRPNVVVASFGDMLRVPGSEGSLLSARATGAHVKIVYSPLDAMQFASSHPEIEVVFFAVGFETTAPATALAVLQAQQMGLKNFSLLVSHVRVQPAMESLMELPGNRVQGFLAAGHVCAVTGFAGYEQFAQQHRVPVVVTGFEPVDLLRGILECVTQLENGRSEVSNSYGRSVNREGNPAAQEIVARVYENCDMVWRGLGLIRHGGCRLREEFAGFDARLRFRRDPTSASSSGVLSDERCKAGLVLSGRMNPCDCPEFARQCTPDSPFGSPMVSSEGACAAYFRYHQRNDGANNSKHAAAAVRQGENE